MINSFEFNLPTKIVFGKGSIDTINDEINAINKKNILIITDKGLVNAGIIKQILSKIDKKNVEKITVYDSVKPNPRDTVVNEAYAVTLKENSDLILAIGGGSAIDTAKGVSLLMTHNGDTINEFEDPEKIINQGAPIIAIPTTVGTGSEVTFWSIITDTKRQYKMGIGSPLIAPVLALLDPDLVKTLPSSVVSSTGVDALTHAIEGYTCKIAEPITDALGLYAIEMISENLRLATYSDSEDAKANMLMASLIAGMCFGQTDVTAVHCMAESLGGLYDVPHGIANACLLPYVMEFNYVADMKKFARVAKAMGENTDGLTDRQAAQLGINAIMELNKDLNIPTLKSLDIKEDALAELAFRSSQNVSVPDNPRPVTEKDFLQIFKNAYDEKLETIVVMP